MSAGYDIAQMYCSQCLKGIPSPSDFRTIEHIRVYFTTGLCQTCQDLKTRKEKENKGGDTMKYTGYTAKKLTEAAIDFSNTLILYAHGDDF